MTKMDDIERSPFQKAFSGLHACMQTGMGDVFLARVGWRPSSSRTGFDTSSPCLTKGLESLELERLFQGPIFGASRQRLLTPKSKGAGQHRSFFKPPHG